ncbi:probable serine/threonine-protein kinase PBL28 isoform X2 [Diospyros lotus]|uniref:probable serine/threonine-protein kinase PBL28 isoform X2 n=1 Tax=Diospyros lotus TaxID=55363 RepID=UPI00225BCF25|nr:probable serine/threonine-protein kinase PBL28 isoform X2 [Diospyros lotus]
MRLFWWQHLPFLILIQLLEPFKLTHQLQAEALLAFKSTVDSSLQLAGKIRRYPQPECVYYHKLKDLCAVSWFRRFCPLSPQIRKIELSHSKASLSSLHSSTQFQVNLYRSRKTTIAVPIGGDSSIPTLTPVQATDGKKANKQKVAAIVGGVVAAFLVLITGVIVYFCLMRLKRLVRRSSDTASSVPSAPALWERENISPGAGAVSPYNTHNFREFSILELQHATGNFNQNNIIGQGLFGLVYKGLLDDGSIVAIKRRLYYPIQCFVNEVKSMAFVHHKHLVKLLGCCEENQQQFLVYDYLPNGNVGNHLYDSEGLPIGKLEMRQRLLIALGLEHLHYLAPPILHMHFRTRNVLVDETFTAKVSDFGLSKLLEEGYHTESSSAFDCFQDPELRSSEDYSERSDVYSFGVFLLELISGREALGTNQSDMQENLVLQAKSSHSWGNFVDKTARDHTTEAVKQMMELALICTDSSSRRPEMKRVVEELERIQERDISRFSPGLSQEIGIVALGSELFK